MAKIVIFGTEDMAQVASYLFKIDSDHEVVAFTKDKSYIKESTFEGLPVVAFEDVEKIYPVNEYQMFIALGYSRLNKNRAKKYEEAKEKGYKFVSYISSRCSFLSQFPIGENTFIFEDNTIQPFVQIGNNVILWSGNHIGHHTVVEDHNFISSHVVISGHCHIKSFCFFGVNATLHNNVTIGSENIIAAGAIISKSTEEKELWLPARSVKSEKRTDEIRF